MFFQQQRVFHRRYGWGRVHGPSFTPAAVLVRFDKRPEGVKVIRVAELKSW
jgi:hypothetical protein